MLSKKLYYIVSFCLGLLSNPITRTLTGEWDLPIWKIPLFYFIMIIVAGGWIVFAYKKVNWKNNV